MLTEKTTKDGMTYLGEDTDFDWIGLFGVMGIFGILLLSGWQF